MPQLERRDICFKSANGKNTVAAYFFENCAEEPWCVVQVVHGMCEYMKRYADFAKFLNANGIIVCGNDHLGHGNTVASPDEYGYFGAIGGRRYVRQDIWEMNRRAHEAYPNLPVVMLGHSMGSFFARKYVTEYPDTVDVLLLSGTSGPLRAAPFGIRFTRLIGGIFGQKHRSGVLNALTFGRYLTHLPKPDSIYDWVSRDKEVVKSYENDLKCSFVFTANGFHELYNALNEVSSPRWAAKVNKDMPILLFSGDEDPVGQFGKGVQQVHGWLSEAGIEDLEIKLYPGGRHEMLNEINKDEVYQDLLAYIDSRCRQGK